MLLDALARRSIRRVGLGSVNGRYFLFHVGIGFDAAVVEQVERRAGLKRYAGHPLFVYAGFDTWIRHYDRSRPRFAVHHADGTVVDDGYLTIVLQHQPLHLPGQPAADVAPEATLDRGSRSVTVRTLEFARILRIIGSALSAAAEALRRSRWVDHRVDLDGRHGPGPRPGPLPGRRRLPRRRRRARFRHDRVGARPRPPLGPALSKLRRSSRHGRRGQRNVASLPRAVSAGPRRS